MQHGCQINACCSSCAKAKATLLDAPAARCAPALHIHVSACPNEIVQPWHLRAGGHKQRVHVKQRTIAGTVGHATSAQQPRIEACAVLRHADMQG